MITISFYSYKGGVGRSLALTNLAVYLAQFGATVVMADFDLEAPGLQYKLRPDGPVAVDGRGLAGLLADVSAGASLEALNWDLALDVTEHAVTADLTIEPLEQPSGRLFLVPAGNPLQSNYWTDLATIDWHRLFTEGDRPGITALAYLKEHLANVYSPDVLLVDSRTGITPGGGVATTLLPDVVVTMLLNTPEHLDGARLVVSAVTDNASKSDPNAPSVLPVLSRYTDTRLFRSQSQVAPRATRPAPLLPESGIDEEDARDALRHALTSELRPEQTARVAAPLILHTDLALQQSERLAFGPYASSGMVGQSQALLDDYLRLFGALVPKELFVQYLAGVRNRVRSILLDNPDDAVRTLESLALLVGDEEVFVDLIKVYVLRQDRSAMLAVADRLFRVHKRIVPHEAISRVLREMMMSAALPRLRDLRGAVSPEFVVRYWQEVGSDDVDWGAGVARFLADSGLVERAHEVAESAIERADGEALTSVVHLIARGGNNAEKLAAGIAREHFEMGARSEAFLKVAAQACEYAKESDLARLILDVPLSVELNAVQRVRLIKIMGDVQQAGIALLEILETSDRSDEQFNALAELWEEIVRATPQLRTALRQRNPTMLHDLEAKREPDDEEDFER
jgi:hypothetical protein